MGSHPRLAQLGPDILSPDLDLEAVTRRAVAYARYGPREVGDLIMDQRIASGIGNVYKSEALFLARIHPRRQGHGLPDTLWSHLYGIAADLMAANLDTGSRTTVPADRRDGPSSPRLWVYRRRGEPCLNCDTSIERIEQGSQLRSTYYCPTCQPA